MTSKFRLKVYGGDCVCFRSRIYLRFRGVKESRIIKRMDAANHAVVR